MPSGIWSITVETRPGINVSADGRPAVSELRDKLGLPVGSIIRFVVRPSINQLPYLENLRVQGYLPLGIIANESFEAGLGSYAALAHWIAETYGNWFWGLQVGNEWDHRSPSSWTLSEAELDALLWTFWNIRIARGGHWKLVLGGSVSGDPENRMDEPDLEAVDYIAVHPYGQRPSEDWNPGRPWGFGNVTDLIERYHLVAPGKCVLVTEYGLPTQDFGDVVSADYHADMAAALEAYGRSRAWFAGYVPFAAADYMVDGYGFLDQSGKLKKQGHAFATMMKVLYPKGIVGDKEMPTFTFILGFKAKADELGREVVGDPVEAEHDAWINGHAARHQATTKGEMVYYKDLNIARFEAGR
jgi:hypothetical protein